MKTIVIACGIGIATSTVVVSKVKELLEENQLEAKIIQCAIADVEKHARQADLIITTMKVENHYNRPVVLGIPLLTGMNVETTKKKILSCLK